MKAYNNLSDKHKSFVDNYIETAFHASRAYELAYPECTNKTARTNSCLLLKKDEIRAAIREKLAKVDKDDVIGKLSEIAFEGKYKQEIQIRALELLGKYLNLWRESQAEQKTVINIAEIKSKLAEKQQSIGNRVSQAIDSKEDTEDIHLPTTQETDSKEGNSTEGDG